LLGLEGISKRKDPYCRSGRSGGSARLKWTARQRSETARHAAIVR
jgi:hypothetical protein